MSGIASEQSSFRSATGEPDVLGDSHDSPMTAGAAPSPELIQARRRLAELESLVENTPVAVIVMDSDERVTDWNPAAAELFGYSAEEALGHTIDALVVGDAGRDEGREVTREAMTTGRAQRIGRRTRKDGTAVDVELMLAPLMVDGEHAGFLAIYHDISEVQRAREHAETLLAVTQVLGKMLSLEQTIEVILDELQRVVPYDSCSVQVIQGTRRVIVGGRGFDDLEALLGVSYDLDDEADPGSHVVRSKRTQVFADVSQHPAFASEVHGGGRIRGWICAPMVVGNRVVGVISVDKFEPGFYDDELAELAGAFAVQAGIAIENARLLEEERAAREQAETLRAAAHSLGSTLGVPEVFDLILTELRKVVPSDGASIQQLEGDELVIVAGQGYPVVDALLGVRYAVREPEDPAYELVQRREIVIVGDVSQFSHFEDSFGAGSIKSWMAVPLLVAGDRLIGMLTLDSFEPDFYTTEHAETASAFAAFAATAIDKARHVSELQRAREYAETLLTVTQVLGKTLSLDDTIQTILGELERVVPFDTCSVQVIQGNRLVIVGGRGFENLEALLGEGFDLDDETSLNVQVVRSKRPEVFADVSQNPHFASPIHGRGRIRGWICAPMLVGDRVIGVISIDKYEPDFYNEELAELATAFSAQAAIAIENARLLETERAAREQAETLRAAAESLSGTLDIARRLRSDPRGAAQGRCPIGLPPFSSSTAPRW